MRAEAAAERERERERVESDKQGKEAAAVVAAALDGCCTSHSRVSKRDEKGGSDTHEKFPPFLIIPALFPQVN